MAGPEHAILRAGSTGPRVQLWGRSAAAGALAVGVVGIVGWGLDVRVLRGAVLGLPPIMPLTSLLVAVAAGALLFPRGWIMARQAVGAACAFCGGGNLLEQAHHLPLAGAGCGLRGTLGTFFPVPVMSSTVLVLLGASLVLHEQPRRSRGAADVLALVAGTLALAALAGRAFGPAPPGDSPDAPGWFLTSPFAAVGLSMLAFGLLFAAPDSGVPLVPLPRRCLPIVPKDVAKAESLDSACLRAAIDVLPEGVLLVGASGEIAVRNRWLDALVGGPEQPVSLCAPDGAPLPLERLPHMQALRTGETHTDVELVLRGSGARASTPVLVDGAPVRDGSGAVVGAMAVVHDIRSRKELDRLREEWASVIAHDLRQPVAQIQMSAHLLMEAGRDPATNLERIMAASRRLVRMIADLTDLSRLETHRLVIEPVDVCLSEIVRGCVESIELLLKDRTVALDVVSDCMVRADPGRIEQILGNLIGNAHKYGQAGTDIRVTVTAREQAGHVEVANRGAAIPAEELPTLFERFRRGSTSGSSSGLGLGLYICKGLVEASGGSIHAESTPRGETCFSFTLPRTS